MLKSNRPVAKYLTVGALLGTISVGAQAATWSDTFVGYRYGTQFTEPNNPEHVDKHILQFTHVSGYSLGQNFFNLDVLQSSSEDPANNSDSGATEAYLAYRHQLHAGLTTLWTTGKPKQHLL